jgi:hypothetical protein
VAVAEANCGEQRVSFYIPEGIEFFWEASFTAFHSLKRKSDRPDA